MCLAPGFSIVLHKLLTGVRIAYHHLFEIKRQGKCLKGFKDALDLVCFCQLHHLQLSWLGLETDIQNKHPSPPALRALHVGL